MKTRHSARLRSVTVEPLFGHQVQVTEFTGDRFGGCDESISTVRAVTVRADGSLEVYDDGDLTYGELRVELIELLLELVGADDLATPCSIAHHGACGPHGWDEPEVPCAIGRARALLDRLGVITANAPAEADAEDVGEPTVITSTN